MIGYESLTLTQFIFFVNKVFLTKTRPWNIKVGNLMFVLKWRNFVASGINPLTAVHFI